MGTDFDCVQREKVFCLSPFLNGQPALKPEHSEVADEYVLLHV